MTLTQHVDNAIIKHQFEGIRDQDGWETLESTVLDKFGVSMTGDILERLEYLQNNPSVVITVTKSKMQLLETKPT